MAVFLFVSGYGLECQLRDRPDYLRRFPLKPLYLWFVFAAAACACAVLNGLCLGKRYDAAEVLLNVLRLRDADGSSRWFLNAILWCYLAFYASNCLFRNRACALACLAVLLAAYALICTEMKLGSWHYNTIVCFFMGALFGTLRLYVGKRGLPALPLFGLMMYSYQWRDVMWLQYLIPPVFLTAMLAFLSCFRFESRRLQQLNGFTFELYLIHLTVLGIAFQGEEPARTGTLLASIAIILTLSFALHSLCRRLWQGLFKDSVQ